MLSLLLNWSHAMYMFSFLRFLHISCCNARYFDQKKSSFYEKSPQKLLPVSMKNCNFVLPITLDRAIVQKIQLYFRIQLIKIYSNIEDLPPYITFSLRYHTQLKIVEKWWVPLYIMDLRIIIIRWVQYACILYKSKTLFDDFLICWWWNRNRKRKYVGNRT